MDTVNLKRFVKGIENLTTHVEKTLNTPQIQRGKTAFEPSESTTEQKDEELRNNDRCMLLPVFCYAVDKTSVPQL